MELYNWGSYTGLHRAPIDPAGTSLIGTTGSGKTTLIVRGRRIHLPNSSIKGDGVREFLSGRYRP
ncbi:ATP-binding protein [Pseudomonas sp. Irchel s3f19]|uniref:ATP-binding protein n=1 Tax=Pseudomonas sp. Irchel s3f19 TaxID=2009146 RepID=UPI00211583DA|nr:ATP-binding protein [Pseudomonas sp. Irchel s3f19]